jgi:hypothetical protein
VKDRCLDLADVGIVILCMEENRMRMRIRRRSQVSRVGVELRYRTDLFSRVSFISKAMPSHTSFSRSGWCRIRGVFLSIGSGLIFT